ncbi:MAG: ADP-ribosylglycohydrolase family protein, partial [Gemmataceae bacterium]|nr:ADP-ribosylglycohydrolase family protein [Gemmataceae bacterium]
MDAAVADRVRGVLFGQAVGDALGFGTEFLPRAEVPKLYPDGLRNYDQITRFAPCEQWRPGDWTDDTDQMLCILDSLLTCGRFDLLDVAARVRHWAVTDGYGMGRTVYAAVNDPRFLLDPQSVARDYWERSGRRVAANGAVMRTSVLGVWDFRHPDRVRHNAEQACLMTHADPRCVGSCVAVCRAISQLLEEVADVDALTASVFAEVAHYHPELRACGEQTSSPTLDVFDLDDGMTPGEPDRLGYTLKALGAGFWALRHAGSF